MPRKKFVQVGWNSSFPMVASEPCRGTERAVDLLVLSDADAPCLLDGLPKIQLQFGLTVGLHGDKALE